MPKARRAPRPIPKLELGCGIVAIAVPTMVAVYGLFVTIVGWLTS